MENEYDFEYDVYSSDIEESNLAPFTNNSANSDEDKENTSFSTPSESMIPPSPSPSEPLKSTRKHMKRAFKKYKAALEEAKSMTEAQTQPSFCSLVANYLDPAFYKEQRTLKRLVQEIYLNQHAAFRNQEETIEKQQDTISELKKVIWKMKSESKCVFCRSQSDSVFYPCGHSNSCYPCAIKCTKKKKVCPFCKNDVESIVHIFK